MRRVKLTAAIATALPGAAAKGSPRAAETGTTMRTVTKLLAAVCLAIAAAGLSGCIPTSKSTAGWGFVGIPYWQADPYTQTIVFGDSLTVATFQDSGGPGWFLLHLRNNTGGHPAAVAAVGGISYAHFVTPSLAAPEYSTIPDYEKFLRPRVTVLALGTNDGRLIAGNYGGYTQQDFQQSAAKAIDSALAVNSCVVLVDTTTHYYPPDVPAYPAQAAGINAYLQSRVQSGGGRVRMAQKDGKSWDEYSAGRADWFLNNGGDYHHTAAGINEYRGFITDNIKSAYDAGC